MTSYPVGLTRDLAENRVMRAHVGGVDMVVWRNSKGALAAWNNRCPHRGMRLSHGFVRGDRLACLYHGWHYAKNGQCAFMPAHPELDPPASIKVQTYALSEASGVIWVSPTDTQADILPPAIPPDLEPLRSITASASEASITTASLQTVFSGSELPQSNANGLLHLGEWRIALLCNPIDATRTQVHILIDAAAALPDRRAVSRWCDALRRAAEILPRNPA